MRSKAFIFVLISFFFVKSSQSQSNELTIKGQTGKLYLEHTVVAKENWYSIGRLYNISPKEIAPFNGLTLDKPLSIGQHLEVPLTAANFSQNGEKKPEESLVPLYHVIQDKEWLYRVSVNHNKVPIADLEKWNNINKDQVKAGMHLIVGYLKVKTALSAFANGTGTAPVAVVTPVGTSGTAASKPATSGTPKNVSNGVSTTATTAANEAATVATTAPTSASTSGTTGGTTNNPTPENTVAAATPAKTEPASTPAPAPVTKPVHEAHAAINFNGGYFKPDFSDGGKSINGLAGTFKSTSGWQDGKYYALMNNVPVGTIVKVSAPTTNKSVYAKILGQLPDMKESAGLTVRLSNAAASELGGGDGKFNVEVSY